MEHVQVTRENLMKAYESADASQKSLLHNLYGRKTFYKNIIDEVQSVLDACEIIGRDPKTIVSADDTPDEAAYKQLKVVAEAMREGKPESECFYYPVFDISGGGFSYYDYGCVSTVARVGARLKVDCPKKAKAMGEKFLYLYKQFLTV